MAKIKTIEVPKTSAQRLDSIVKSARKIMRKDKGLNGDLDRLPMLTWVMFLKFLDDLERIHEDESALAGKKFHAAIEAPYRWRDWAALKNGITGSDLISFISDKEAVRPDGTKGPGLFAYLRSLRGRNGGRDRRDVIATAFKGLSNRMESGYLLRDIVNLVDDIHFNSSEEIHTLSRLYEGLLREMRDAAGDSGEFYTPRTVVRLMVELTDPKLGEVVMDPACGTGGFLAEAFSHLEKQANTVEKRKILQGNSIKGGEAKSLPYLLAQMNLLLHGLEAPDIDPGNSLRFRLSEIGDRDRVDIVLTNPPFGGEEEKGIESNFPPDMQTSETALLFTQLIMRRLRRGPTVSQGSSRAAIVVSDGFLSTKGVASRVKEKLLADYNLHTIIRLPRGVFVPYTPIATNILFFDASGPTSDVWYFEIPGPRDRQTYSKTKPFRYEEFTDCLSWWKDRVDGPLSWKVSATQLRERGFDLDVTNPSSKPSFSKKHPDAMVADILGTSQAVHKCANSIASSFSWSKCSAINSAPLVSLSTFLRPKKEFITIDDDASYKLVTLQLHARGIKHREEKHATEIKTKKQQLISKDDLIVAEIDAKLGGFGIAPEEAAGAIVSSHYFLYEIDQSIVDIRFFEWWLRSGLPEQLIQPHVKGSTNYAAIRQHHFMMLEMRLPLLDVQKAIISELEALSAKVAELRENLKELDSESGAFISAILVKAFGDEFVDESAAPEKLRAMG